MKTIILQDDEFEEFKKDKPLGVQQAVVKVITERLAEEVREANNSADTWLLKHLKENDWWIRKEHARKFAKRLGLKAAHHAYYRDTNVFLPDVKYGKEFTPVARILKQISQLATMVLGRIILVD